MSVVSVGVGECRSRQVKKKGSKESEEVGESMMLWFV